MDYKEILKGIVNIINTTEKSDIGFANICTYIGENCPELAESDDERIRKELIKETKGSEVRLFETVTNDEFVAWLEKQAGKDKLIQELGKYKVKYTQEVLEKHINSMSNKDDERLRKTTIAFLKDFAEQGYENAVECIDWLEKQGEQKPIYNFNAVDWQPSKVDGKIHNIYNSRVEPKFNVGDWITNGYCKYQITFIDSRYWYSETHVLGDVESIDKKYHLWTIADAKDGDVLLFEGYYNSIVLFQGIGINGKGRINYHCKCGLGDYSFSIQGDVACLGTIEKDAEHYHPATKEQRDLLFQKMKEAGYEWDAEKKELKKIHKTFEKANW